jgi:DNA-binding transcriptional ArsR family regulator
MASQAQLDSVFGALSDATRRAILARLVEGEATVNELIEPFDLKQPTISKHLKVLERAGLVSRGREAQFRPVHLNAAPLADAASWIGGYRRLWEDSFDRLDALLGSKQSTRKKGKQHGRKR